MIVLLGGGEVAGPKKEFLPGAFMAPDQDMFRKAYAHMAERAGLTLAQAVEMRYDHLRRERVQALTRSAGRELHAASAETSEVTENGEPYPEAQPGELREELALFGEGPPDGAAPGGAERIAWFQAWLDKHEVQEQPALSRQELLMTLARNPAAMMTARARGVINPRELRLIEVPAVDILKPSVEAHRALRWDDRLQDLCGQQGRVMMDDLSDGTSQVTMLEPKLTAWLPTDVLINREKRHKVQITSSLEELQAAIDAHVALRWRDEMAKLVGCVGEIIRTDPSDNTTEVISEVGQAWLPNSTLTDLGEFDVEEPEVQVAQKRVVVNVAPHELHQAVESHPGLKWDRRYTGVLGKVGVVSKEDPNDGTSKVFFRDAGQGGMTIWLPTKLLEDAPAEAAPEAQAAGEEAAATEPPAVEASAAGEATAAGEAAPQEAEPDVKRRKVDT
eukprot:SRR837773.14324.p1 GENE.SRR837773.14324~~SRR837773.14324.p1  ORF type:complete len:513 (-),score=131.58 SRR837773.14324:2-1339(-)